MEKKRIVVGRNDGTGRRRWFSTLRQAEEYLGSLKDQKLVQAGAYYIDVPESVVNPRLERTR